MIREELLEGLLVKVDSRVLLIGWVPHPEYAQHYATVCLLWPSPQAVFKSMAPRICVSTSCSSYTVSKMLRSMNEWQRYH